METTENRIDPAELVDRIAQMATISLDCNSYMSSSLGVGLHRRLTPNRAVFGGTLFPEGWECHLIPGWAMQVAEEGVVFAHGQEDDLLVISCITWDNQRIISRAERMSASNPNIYEQVADHIRSARSPENRSQYLRRMGRDIGI